MRCHVILIILYIIILNILVILIILNIILSVYFIVYFVVRNYCYNACDAGNNKKSGETINSVITGFEFISGCALGLLLKALGCNIPGI